MTGLAVIRAIHFAAGIQVIGALLFCWLLGGAPPSGTRVKDSSHGRWLVQLALLSVAVVAVSGVAWLALQVADMSDGGLTAGWTGGGMRTVLFRTHAGTIWCVRLAIMALLGIGLFALARRAPTAQAAIAVALVLAVANFISCAWLSHAAADPGRFGTLHLGIHAAHMLGISLWLGGLIPLAILLSAAQPSDEKNDLSVMHRVSVRFGNIALFAVVVIGLTGVANTALLVQDASDLTSGAFAKLLAGKLLLLLFMLVLAAYNRQWLVPRLMTAEPFGAMRRLRRSVWAEVALAAVVLFIAGALGITPPGGASR